MCGGVDGGCGGVVANAAIVPIWTTKVLAVVAFAQQLDQICPRSCCCYPHCCWWWLLLQLDQIYQGTSSSSFSPFSLSSASSSSSFSPCCCSFCSSGEW